MLLEAFQGGDVVITVFPANLVDPWTYSGETRNLIRLVKKAGVPGVPRLVGLVGSAGAWVNDREHLVDTDYFQETTRHFYQNVHASWDVYREEKELDWAVVVPAARMQIHLPYLAGQYRTRTDERLVVTDSDSRRYFVVSQISYGDCAHAMLDEVERHTYTHHFSA